MDHNDHSTRLIAFQLLMLYMSCPATFKVRLADACERLPNKFPQAAEKVHGLMTALGLKDPT